MSETTQTNKEEVINQIVNNDWEAEWKKRKEQASVRAEVNKQRIFEMLNHLNFNIGKNITSVEVAYSGSGDSGCIDDYTFNLSDNNEFIYLGAYAGKKFMFSEKMTDEDKKQIESSTIQIEKVIVYLEDCVYDLLEANHGGWEINDGQSGKFEFNCMDDQKVISHEYTRYFSDSESGNEEY